MGWRETKATARAAVQTAMRIPVLYLTSLTADGDSNSAGVLPQIGVRLHLQNKLIGDQVGTSLNSAERWEETPVAIFWVEELDENSITLARGAVLSVAEGEAYQIENVRKPDVETVTCDIFKLSAAKADGLPLPEEE